MITPLDERLAHAANMSLESQTWDDLGLNFILQRIETGTAVTRYRVSFKHPGIEAYRMLDEGWRLNDPIAAGGLLWPALGSVEPSPWAAELRDREPLAEGMYAHLRHYLIATQNGCFDVLTHGEAPVIEQISWQKL